MFKHIFITRLKCLLREKSLVFWTLIFPIALGTFFNLAFSNLESAELFEPIDIAVIDNEEFKQDQNFKTVLDSLSNDSENKIFNIIYTNEEEAKKLLSDSKISGYIHIEENIKLVISNNGFNQTIIKTFLDNYLQTTATVSSIININPEAIKNGLLEEINKHQNYIQDISNKKMDASVVYFYTLIGMVCMYAGFWGIKTVNESEANLSGQGARLCLSPVHKLKAFIYSILAAFLIQFIELLIILAYLILGLKVDFGDQIGYILLLCFIGSFTGIIFGSMISALTTKNENLKSGIMISVSMILSFLSGMMVMDMKYIIADKFPLLANINPVNLITDALYSLYYYDTYTRFFTNIGYLTIFTIVCTIITYFLIRRRKYASL